MIKKSITIQKLSLVLVFVVIFFVINSSYAACTADMLGGSNALPGNNESAGNCRSYATNGDQRYDNRQNNSVQNLSEDGKLFLKIIGLNWSDCNATSIANIQQKMQDLGGNCSTCKDGRAGSATRDKIGGSCLSKTCPSPLSNPILVNGNLKCTNGMLNIDNCCEEAAQEKFCNDSFTQTERDSWIGGQYSDLAINFDKNNCCRKSDTILLNQKPQSMQTIVAICDGVSSCDNPPIDNSCTYLGNDYEDNRFGCCELIDELEIEIEDDDETCTLPTIYDLENNIGCCMPKNSWEDCDNSADIAVILEEDGDDLSLLTEINYKCKTQNGDINFCSCDAIGADGQCECNEENLECDPDEKIVNCKCVCDSTKQCCGIELNTVVPFIGDCIEMTTQNNTAGGTTNTSSVNQLNAFPFLMMGMSKILVTVILIFSFLIVIVAGLMMMTGVASEGNYKKGMEWIQKIVVALILLGSSGLILKLINPSFFGG